MFVIESREREATTTIRVVLPNSLHARLSAAGEKAKVDIQEVVRQAIGYALAKSEDASNTPTGRKRRAVPRGSSPCSLDATRRPKRTGDLNVVASSETSGATT